MVASLGAPAQSLQVSPGSVSTFRLSPSSKLDFPGLPLVVLKLRENTRLEIELCRLLFPDWNLGIDSLVSHY